MSFNIIACIGQNRELGINNQLVFHIKEDMDYFRQTTIGHPVLMGRKTYESIGKALPNRKNLVITHHPKTLPNDVTAITNLDDFIKEHQSSDEEIFVIGGASVYQAILPYAQALYLTEVDSSAPTDAYFPIFDQDLYDKIIIKKGVSEGLEYAFAKYIKKEIR